MRSPEDLERWQLFVRGDLPSYSRDRQYVRKDGAVMWANLRSRSSNVTRPVSPFR